MNNIYIIAAMARTTRVIGKNGELPWGYLPEDMKDFAQKTKNNIVVMGHNTFKSLGCAPLANRINIVLTTRQEYRIRQAHIFHKLEDIMEFISPYKVTKDIFIIGGAQIYTAFLEQASRMYLTEVERLDGLPILGDTRFPEFDRVLEYRLVLEGKEYTTDKYKYQMNTYANIMNF